jgi:hypothetical protein
MRARGARQISLTKGCREQRTPHRRCAAPAAAENKLRVQLRENLLLIS